jgi:hypothetical protein
VQSLTFDVTDGVSVEWESGIKERWS